MKQKTRKQKIVDYILENWKEELEEQTEITDLELLVDISVDIERAELIEYVWFARRSNALEEWLSAEFYSHLISKVIIITQEAEKSFTGANSKELAENIVQSLLDYEREAEVIEEIIKDKVREELEEEDVDINPKCRGFEK